jgi:hypothetical protein
MVQPLDAGIPQQDDVNQVNFSSMLHYITLHYITLSSHFPSVYRVSVTLKHQY